MALTPEDKEWLKQWTREEIDLQWEQKMIPWIKVEIERQWKQKMMPWVVEEVRLKTQKPTLH